MKTTGTSTKATVRAAAPKPNGRTANMPKAIEPPTGTLPSFFILFHSSSYPLITENSKWEVSLVHEDITANLLETKLVGMGDLRMFAMSIHDPFYKQSGLMDAAMEQLRATSGAWSEAEDENGEPNSRHPCLFLIIEGKPRWTVSTTPIFIGYHE